MLSELERCVLKQHNRTQGFCTNIILVCELFWCFCTTVSKCLHKSFHVALVSHKDGLNNSKLFDDPVQTLTKPKTGIFSCHWMCFWMYLWHLWHYSLWQLMHTIPVTWGEGRPILSRLNAHTVKSLCLCKPFEKATPVRDTQKIITHFYLDRETKSAFPTTRGKGFVKSLLIVTAHTSLPPSGLYLAALIVIELEIWLN